MVLDITDRNLLVYEQMKDKLLEEHHGEIAIFCDGKLAAVGRDLKEGVKRAREISKGKELFIKELFRPEEQTKAIL